jgi:MSHA biogenesis protein MshL
MTAGFIDRGYKTKGMILTFVLLMLGGCHSSISPIHNQNINAMQQTLRQGAIADQNSTPGMLPSAVTNTLFPQDPTLDFGNEVTTERFNIAVKDMPAATFFLNLTNNTPDNILVSPAVSGNITLSLKNVTLSETLDAIENLYGYGITKNSYGYQIKPRELETKMFVINHLNVSRSGSSSTTVNSGSGSNGSIGGGSSGVNTQTSSTEFWQNLQATIEMIIKDNPQAIGNTANNETKSTTENNLKLNQLNTNNKTLRARNEALRSSLASAQENLQDQTNRENYRRNQDRSNNTSRASHFNFNRGTRSINQSQYVKINPISGLIVVKAYPKSIHAVEKYLAATQNIMGRQVLIEANILEVELNKQFQYGINWSMLSDHLNTSYQQDSTNNNTGRLAGLMSPTTSGNIFKLDASIGDFTGFIHMLTEQGHVSVLSSPRVTTLNNQKAIIKIGTDAYYVTGISSNITPDAGSSITSNNVNIQPFFSGISLGVTPQIDHNNDIILHIHPTISMVKQTQTILRFNGKTNFFPTAQTRVRETDSVVKAKNGQVIIIGGLMQTATDLKRSTLAPLEQTASTSFLNDFFRNRDDTSQKSELVILLRPIVISPDGWAETLSKTADRHFKRTVKQKKPSQKTSSPPEELLSSLK